MTDSSRTANPADAELLIAPGCPHCPATLEAMGKLLKDGLIGRLNVTNIALHPAELREWAEYAATGSGMSSYLAYLLQQQQLDRVVALIRQSPALLHELIPLLADLQTPMGVRIGIGAVFEELQESGLLSDVVHELGALTHAAEPQVRADACHYLGLSGAAEAADYVRPLLDDDDAEVREIAGESLPLLAAD
jgi:HEAT repeat protein